MAIPVIKVTEAEALILEGEEYAPGKFFNVKENAGGEKWISTEERKAYFTHDNTKGYDWLLDCPTIDHDPILYDDEGNRIN